MLRSIPLKSVLKARSLRVPNRNFHCGLRLCKGSLFNMPAMSPTMSEGGVVSWKYKAGEEFSAGDVLLEVETDKATIDVEAQDDGVMWEILVDEGAKGVPVGKPIALLAEPGDDLSTLEKPNIEEGAEVPEPSATAGTNTDEVKDVKAKSTDKPKEDTNTPTSSTSSGSDVFGKANSSQKLSPSVELLLHQNHISVEDAYSKIPASGPKGRLLKGDILAYLGDIKRDSVIKITNFIKSREHLDLSNVIIAEPKPKEDGKKKEEVKEEQKPKNVLTLSVVSELEPETSRQEFISSFEKTLRDATRGSYAQRFPQYSKSPIASKFVETDAFDDIITPPVYETRFSVYDIQYNFHSTKSASSSVNDVFDDLVGHSTTLPLKSGLSHESPTSVSVDFKVKYNESLVDSKEFVTSFQDSLFTNIPSRRLTITN